MAETSSRQRWWVRRRRPLLLVGVVLLLVVGFTCWLAFSAARGRSALEAARGHLEQARSAVAMGNGPAAHRELTLAADDAADARSATSAFPWTMAAALPYVGQPFRTARDLAVAADDLVVQVLAPAARAGDVLVPDRLHPSGGRIDLTGLTTAQAPLAEAAAAAALLNVRVQAIAPAGYLAQVEQARRTLQTDVAELADALATASTALTLLPSMLGADGPRSYLLVFQTNAEARGTGGILGGYGILTADQGRVMLDALASNRDLRPGPAPGLDLGPDYAQQYTGYSSTRAWQNANSSPHFPYAAQIWSSLWAAQGGQHIDGVIGLDPVALSRILRATGSVTLPSGELITADNVVHITESEHYVRFSDDNRARKAYLQSIAAAVARKVLDGRFSPTALLTALRTATEESRLAVWSAVPAEQDVLAGTALGHVVPRTAGPYASLIVLDARPSKLDYYLGRTLSYTAGDCSGSERRSLVTVDLRNGAPTAPLPAIVAGPPEPTTGPPNTSKMLVSLYATEWAQLHGVTLDGVPTGAHSGAERGHPVFTLTLFIPPGGTQRLVFDLVEPTSPGQPIVPVQPLVEPMAVTTSVPDCSGS